MERPSDDKNAHLWRVDDDDDEDDGDGDGDGDGEGGDAAAVVAVRQSLRGAHVARFLRGPEQPEVQPPRDGQRG